MHPRKIEITNLSESSKVAWVFLLNSIEIIVGVPWAEHYMFMIIIQYALQQHLNVATALGLHCAGS